MSPSAQQEMPGRWRQTAERCWRELLRCRCQWLQLLTVTGGSWMIVWAAVETFTTGGGEPQEPWRHTHGFCWLLMTSYDLCWRGFFQRKGHRCQICQMSQNLNTCWPAGCCASSCSPSWLQPGQLTPPGKSHQASGIRSYTACWHDNLRNITTRSNGSERRFGPQLVDCSDCSLAQGLVYFIIFWNVCIYLSFKTGLSVVLLILPLKSTTPRQI